MYRDGIGVSKNDQEAFKWFSLAAKQNDPEAQYNVGTMYAKGKGVQQNMQEALIWMKRAAEQGDQEAQAFLDDFSKSAQSPH